VSRYKVFKWSGIYPGIVILLTAVVRSGFVKHYDPVLVAGVKAKTMTSLLIFTGVVSKSAVIFLSCRKCSKGTMLFIFFVNEQDLSFKVN